MAYGVKYECGFTSIEQKVKWRVFIEQDDYTGPITDVPISAFPLTITWEGRDDEFYEPIKSSSLELQLECDRNLQYIDLFTSNPKKYRISVRRNEAVYWQGFLSVNDYVEPFDAPPYSITLTANDGWHFLDDLPYLKDDGSRWTGHETLRVILARILSNVPLNMSTVDIIGLSPNDNYIATLNAVKINNDFLYHHKSDITCKEILEMILRSFGAQLFQTSGSIYIRRVLNLINQRQAPITLWQNDNHILGGSTLKLKPALKKATIKKENTDQTDITKLFGLYEIDKWVCSSNCYMVLDGNVLTIRGQNNGSAYIENDIDACSNVVKFEGQVYNRVISEEHIIKFQIINYNAQNTAYYNALQNVWVNEPTDISISLHPDAPSTLSIELPNIPFTGKLQFLHKTTNTWLFIKDFTLSLEFSEREIMLAEEAVSLNGYEDVEIAMPIGDIPAMSNAKYIFPLYFSDLNNQNTSFWSDGSYVATLSEHLINDIVTLRNAPHKMIDGTLDSRQNYDFNSLFKDDKYSGAIYYMNYLRLSAIEDLSEVQLVQLAATNTKRPAMGNDCVLEYHDRDFSPRINLFAKLDYKVFMAVEGGTRLFVYDVLTKEFHKIPFDFLCITCLSESPEAICVGDSRSEYESIAYAFNYAEKLITSVRAPVDDGGAHNIQDAKWSSVTGFWLVAGGLSGDHGGLYNEKYGIGSLKSGMNLKIFQPDIYTILLEYDEWQHLNNNICYFDTRLFTEFCLQNISTRRRHRGINRRFSFTTQNHILFHNSIKPGDETHVGTWHPLSDDIMELTNNSIYTKSKRIATINFATNTITEDRILCNKDDGDLMAIKVIHGVPYLFYHYMHFSVWKYVGGDEYLLASEDGEIITTEDGVSAIDLREIKI